MAYSLAGGKAAVYSHSGEWRGGVVLSDARRKATAVTCTRAGTERNSKTVAKLLSRSSCLQPARPRMRGAGVYVCMYISGSVCPRVPVTVNF